jgi:hypothetical protein
VSILILTITVFTKQITNFLRTDFWWGALSQAFLWHIGIVFLVVMAVGGLSGLNYKTFLYCCI